MTAAGSKCAVSGRAAAAGDEEGDGEWLVGRGADAGADAEMSDRWRADMGPLVRPVWIELYTAGC